MAGPYDLLLRCLGVMRGFEDYTFEPSSWSADRFHDLVHRYHELEDEVLDAIKANRLGGEISERPAGGASNADSESPRPDIAGSDAQ